MLRSSALSGWPWAGKISLYMVNLYRRPWTKLMIYFSECISFRPLPYEYPSKDPFGTSTYRANFRKSNDPKQGTLPTSPLRKNNPHPQSMTNAFNFPNRVSVSSRYDVMIWACDFRFLFWSLNCSRYWAVAIVEMISKWGRLEQYQHHHSIPDQQWFPRRCTIIVLLFNGLLIFWYNFWSQNNSI